jgi:hypothetical protein
MNLPQRPQDLANRVAESPYPPGHFYSPLPDPRELAAEPRYSQLYPTSPPETPGVDWRDEAQLELCRVVFAAQKRIRFADVQNAEANVYTTSNDQFGALDAWVLEAMLRALSPKNMIEVGSGYSSLVTAAVNRDYLGYELDFMCIEPYPRQFLLDGVPGVSDVLVSKIQDVPLDTFSRLSDGDVLFIDTSHVVKTGGDVPWIYNQVLPRLAAGVYVHIHDIFLPNEYPWEWVLRDGRAWSEQYLVQSFLSFNAAFEVVFGVNWMCTYHRSEMSEAFPGMARYGGGGSLWLRRAGGNATLSAETA